MRVSSSVRESAAESERLRSRPKPYSVERRFQMMQAGASALGLLMISIVLYWNQSFDRPLELSLRQLHATLALNTELHAHHESTALAFWEGYFAKEAASASAFEEQSRQLGEVVGRFVAFQFPAEDRAVVEDLHRLEERFQSLTRQLMAGPRHAEEDKARLSEVNHLTGEIELNLHRLEEAQMVHLEALGAERQRLAIGMTVLLIGFGGCAVVIAIWSRREHKNHLWCHLERLRLMVAEIRRGNLNVCGEIPQSLELGSLTSAFFQMALELRAMRNSLEAKVVERTTKLEQAQKELLQAAKLASLGELVSGVAHEINNPLTSILGFSEITLNRTKANPEIEAPLRAIRDEALRLRHLVANLTAFARRAPQRSQRLDLRPVLMRFVELRDYQLRANNIALHLSSPAEPVWVLADAEQLLQVVMNLVVNSEQAIKELRERGDIWLACGSEGDYAWFSVKDNGPGMEPEVCEHVFDPFFTTKAVGKGTGLGLSVSHGILRQHGGHLTAESEPGKGTTIRATLPFAAAGPDEPLAESPAPAVIEKEAEARGGRHVLVIDDEPDILEMVTEALEPVGCRTTTLQGSQGVDAALAQGDIDLVLCDLKMPGQNGFEVYRLICERHPEFADRFILMTGNLADADRYGADIDAITLLPKPFTLARLREAVEEILRKRIHA
jgi:signal transduction histidine kinase